MLYNISFLILFKSLIFNTLDLRLIFKYIFKLNTEQELLGKVLCCVKNVWY